MAFDTQPPKPPAFDMDAYMERFCGRSDLVSNHPKGISHLSKEDQLAFCLREADALVLGPSRARLSPREDARSHTSTTSGKGV